MALQMRTKSKIDTRLYTPQEVAVYMAAALLSCRLMRGVVAKAYAVYLDG